MNFGDFLGAWIAEPLGFVWGDLILVLVLVTSLIFFALGLRSGLILLWMSLGLIYMAYYNLGIDTLHVLTLFILVGVIMVVSILISHSREKSGVVGL